MSGGAFDRLLWNGLHPGVFELSESEVGARLAPQDKETVLLFQLDEPHNELRYAEPEGTRICDGLFFYRRKKRAQPWLLFFELKHGEAFDRALTQLVSAIRLLTKNLHERCDTRQPASRLAPEARSGKEVPPLRRIHAVVVSGHEAPPDRQPLQKEFRELLRPYSIRASLGFVPCTPRSVANLRDELTARMQQVPGGDGETADES